MTLVAWHDVECGGYDVDLDVWRALAAAHAGSEPVLDVGAGTGRVALHLAAHGHAVMALDTEPAFLRALEERGQGLPVQTVIGDARRLDLDGRFGLIIAPMQTVQLLGGPGGRAAFLAGARRHLRDGGVLAAAIAHPLETFDAREVQPPAPDIGDADGVQLVSRPVAIRDEGERVALVREREAVGTDGRRTSERDVIRLDRISPDELSAEGAARPACARRAAADPGHR